MIQGINDINSFRQLRKQLQPILKEDANLLLERIEEAIGAGSLLAPQLPKKKKPTHKERVLKYLIPK